MININKYLFNNKFITKFVTLIFKTTIMTTKRKQFIFYGGILAVSIPLGVLSSMDKQNVINTLLLILAAAFAVILTFNFTVRKVASFKSYFSSKYNLLTEKIRWEKDFDLSCELLFDKIIEVINDSEFELVNSDREKSQIFAISKMKASSWGENLYFEFEAKGDDTRLKFCSAAIYGFQTFGGKRNNWEKFMHDFEESLTI